MENHTASSKEHEGGSTTILSGPRLTIENAADFAARIREAMATAKVVTVEFEANLEVDVTVLQILCSACKTAAVESKTLTYQGSGTQDLRQLITAAGGERSGPCRHNNGNQCIWFGGYENG